ncbi:MAG: GNAT family N-acetyltransferase [Candidatus Aenigmarchaeota archaeon]|nr:GNAT family N-acetyltransferase [Candidatus Aenigmarchaeota archaeon]
MRISIRLARKSDIRKYTSMLQRTYQDAYTSEKLGLTKGCFSRKVFSTPDTQKYLKSSLVINRKQKTWLAFSKSKLIGSITIIDRGKEFELRGFYVSPKHQGKGIGKQLRDIARGFAKRKDIVLDIYAHNRRTINTYKRWGFVVDRKKGVFYRHWQEWPGRLKAKCIYMRLSQKKKRF